jgi:hypothetical protein
MFCDLQALLQCKLEAKQRARAEQQRGGRAGVNQQDEAYLKAMDAQVHSVQVNVYYVTSVRCKFLRFVSAVCQCVENYE